MKIALLTNPWAADAAHIIEAIAVDEWRDAIVALKPGRFAAAIYLIGDSRPHIVQRFHGTAWPPAVVSGDGFFVVRTGQPGFILASDQWSCIAEFPAMLKKYDQFAASTARGLVRKSVYGGPIGIIGSEGASC